MGFATEHQLSAAVAQPAPPTEPGLIRQREQSTRSKKNKLPPLTASSQDADPLSLAARATNDAIRDWNVTAGALCWPQGLDTLLGLSGIGY